MSEKALWNNLRKKMVPDFWKEATRHEDAFQRGIADVSFCQFHQHGWMELKFVGLAPKRETTIVRVPHYTNDQRNWLRAKGAAAGGTFVLLQLESDYLLFDWYDGQHVGKVNKADLYDLACYVSRGKLEPMGLKTAIGHNW